jgi:hypothetical protein
MLMVAKHLETANKMNKHSRGSAPKVFISNVEWPLRQARPSILITAVQ